jgi:FkbM family methyltransferase
VQTDNFKIYVNPRSIGVEISLILSGYYEKHIIEIMREILKPGMVVLDIGANIGYHTLISSKLVGNTGKIYSFEPEPHNFKLLLKNIEINEFKNIIPINKALSNNIGSTKLFLDTQSDGKHSLSEKNVNTNKFIEVEKITLDSFYENMGENRRIDFIKIDVEGAEGLVIKGGGKLLKENDIMIIMEFIPFYIRNLGASPEKLLSLLMGFGFEFYLIEQKVGTIVKSKIGEILRISREKYDDKGDIYLFMKKAYSKFNFPTI